MGSKPKGYNKKILLLFVALAVLFIASQITRFQNELVIEYDGQNITAKVHKNVLSMPLSQAEFTEVAASFHKSAAAENGIGSFELSDGSSKIFSRNRPIVYLFGKDVLGTMVKGTYPGFKRTFGDWLMDRFRSEEVVLYDKSLPQEFVLSTKVIGRGRFALFLHGTHNVTVNFRDGLLDNDFSLCLEDKCPDTAYNKEKLFTNVMRVSNFFIEGLVLSVLVILLVSFLFHNRFSSLKTQSADKREKDKKLIWTVGLLAVVHFLLAVYFSIGVLGAVPHIPDSADYYMQGIMLGKGMLYISNFTHQPREAFKFMFSSVKDGRFYFQYNHFWPALLAIPIKLGVGAFLNPLLSAASLVLIFLIARRLFNAKVGVIAALLYCVSPFAILQAGDFMLHVATQFCILAALYMLLTYVQTQRKVHIILAGFLFGYALGLRIPTALAIALPIGIYFAAFYRKELFNKRSSWFFIGFLPVLFLLIMDNYAITGSALRIAHPITTNVDTGSFTLSRFSVNSLAGAANTRDSNLGFLPPMVFYGFLPMLFIAFALIPLIIFRKKEDWLLVAIFASLFISQFLISAHGLHGYGPRYLFEAFFALCILVSRGVLWSVEWSRKYARIALCVLFALLVVHNLFGLYAVLPMYKNYNSLNTDLLDEIKKVDLANSIIVTENNGWWDLGIAATLFDPEYKKSFFIKALPDNSHEKILRENPDRKVYRIEDKKIVPHE